jgi:hypothetical protein
MIESIDFSLNKLGKEEYLALNISIITHFEWNGQILI